MLKRPCTKGTARTNRFAVAHQDGIEPVRELLDQRGRRARLLCVHYGLIIRHAAKRHPAVGLGLAEQAELVENRNCLKLVVGREQFQH
jgi:hypothetical protein